MISIPNDEKLIAQLTSRQKLYAQKAMNDSNQKPISRAAVVNLRIERTP
jgi:hypothetical protein